MPKMKTHKATLKRLRITRTGKARHKRANCKHLRSSKSPDRLRRLRQDAYLSASDARRVSRLLNMKIRGRDQPRSAVRRSPSPAERKAKREAARQQAAAE